MSIAFPSFPTATAYNAVTPLQVATPLSAALEQRIQQGPERRPDAEPTKAPLLPPSTEARQAQPDRAALQRSVQDLLGHFRELQHATRSEINQTRNAVEQRLDELAAALHTDMRRVRNEAHSETETLHKDLFHSATTLSHVQDRLSRLESAFHTLLQKMHVSDAATAAPVPKAEPSRRAVFHPLAR